MNDFMKGRNGADELTIVTGFAGIVIAMIGSIARIQWLSWIAIAVIVIGCCAACPKYRRTSQGERGLCRRDCKRPCLGKFVASLGGGPQPAPHARHTVRRL
ncbi:MAG: hypothetical protein ACLRM9_04250 [Collinsella aerofaciens]